MLLQTCFGNENWPAGQTKVHLFLCPTRDMPLEGKEVHLWMASRGNGKPGWPVITGVGGTRTVPAGAGMKPEIVGKWSSQVYDIPPDALIKVSVSRSAGGSSTLANVLIRMRETAAHNKIRVTLIPNNASVMQSLDIEGRFDILDEQAATAAGYTIPAMYRPTYQRSRWTRLSHLSIIELSPETVSPLAVVAKQVEDGDGNIVEVKSSRRRRAFGV